MALDRVSPAVSLACAAALAFTSACSRPTEAPKPPPVAETPAPPAPPPPPAAPMTHEPSAQAAAGTVATVELAALGTSGVTGTATFTVVDRATAGGQPAAGETAATGLGLRVQVDVTGLAPGSHGLHVHEWGDCSAPDGTSAGSHFNPHGSPHGDRMAAQRHPGDFGNIEADASGHATLDFCCLDAPLTTAADGLLGRSLIVHGAADDLMTQPTGNSGPRVACGVIKVQGGDTQPVLAAGGATP